MSTASPEQLQNLKAGMKAVWMAGDFGQIAKRNEEEAENFISRLKLHAGMRVLDVACGTGNLSIPAAKLGARVTGLDIATNLLEQARQRAKEQGLSDTEFVEGDAEQIQFPDASFDAVVTMYGAMFAPRPELVAKELLRVCKPGGFIAMANWTPEGFVGEMFSLSSKHVPPPAGVSPPAMWGNEDVARQRFTGAAKGLGIDPEKLRFEFHKRMHVMRPQEEAEQTVDFFVQYFGPTKVAFSKLDPAGQGALRKDLVALWNKYNEGASGSAKMVVSAEYLEVIVRRE